VLWGGQIPDVMWETTRPRLLTMAFEDGCCATDVAQLKRQGLSLSKVSNLVSEVFCEQVRSCHRGRLSPGERIPLTDPCVFVARSSPRATCTVTPTRPMCSSGRIPSKRCYHGHHPRLAHLKF
jgi:hypothetical protein